jgi:branched-chain amino acid transport system ATP-binding protein
MGARVASSAAERTSFMTPAGAPLPAKALVLKDVYKSFGTADIILGVNIEIARGELHAIIGPNGAGKTTLFGLMSGLIAPNRGEIFLDGRPITGLPAYKINRLGLSRSFQVTNFFPRMSVEENIRCACLWSAGEGYKFWGSANDNAEIAEKAEAILHEMQLAVRRSVPAGILSYAEQRALEIGVTIAGGARVILLDEPTAGMSRHESDRMIELIGRIAKSRTLVIVEHDMSVVFGLAGRISVLVHGKIIRTDVPAAIRSCPRVKEAYLGETAW